MERSDLPTADTSRTPPHLHQARAGALPLPAQCLPPTLTSAPAVHATPAQGAAPGPSGAALPGVPALERQGPPLAAQTGRAAGASRRHTVPGRGNNLPYPRPEIGHKWSFVRCCARPGEAIL